MDQRKSWEPPLILGCGRSLLQKLPVIAPSRQSAVFTLLACDSMSANPSEALVPTNTLSRSLPMEYRSQMPKPVHTPIPPDELIQLAQTVIKYDKFPYLATLDGDQPRGRPISPVRTEGFTIYVANLRFDHKTGEIAANPKVELCYLDDVHNQVRLTGTAVRWPTGPCCR